MNDPKSIVVDASVVINIVATGRAEDVLRALPCKVLVSTVVEGELESGLARGRLDYGRLRELVRSGVVELVEFGPIGERYFEQLVLGSSVSTLDDGEAASISCALELGAAVAIDDQKAIRVCSALFPSLSLMSTVGVLRFPQILEVLGSSGLEKAVLNALLIGRMRVLAEDLDWIVEKIGIEQAVKCPSLSRSGLASRRRAPNDV